MKILAIFLGSKALGFTLENKEASQFLKRSPRANSNSIFGPEEFLEGRLKQECYDEDCSHSEAMEAIEDIKMASVYFKANKNPCDTFNLCDTNGSLQSCTNRNEQGAIIKNGGYRCICRSNWAGELCNIDCDNKKEPKPLTIGLDPLETFDSSGFIHQEFSHVKAYYSDANEGGRYKPLVFNVEFGGFPNVWMSNISDEQWLSIDLGTSRSVLKVAFRGGYYKGVSCTPAMITMDTYKTPDSQPSERDRKTFNLDQNSIEPHIEEISMVYGQVFKFKINKPVGSVPRPACLAVELFGYGGRTPLPALDQCTQK